MFARITKKKRKKKRKLAKRIPKTKYFKALKDEVI